MSADKGPVVTNTTCSRCGGALMPDTIFCQACGSACPEALAAVRTSFGHAGAKALGLPKNPHPVELTAVPFKGGYGVTAFPVRAFADVVRVSKERVSLDRETVPGTLFVRIVLDRALEAEETRRLFELVEAEQAKVTHLKLQVDVQTDVGWCTIGALGENDRRPVLITVGETGSSAAVFLSGSTIGSTGATLGEALTKLRSMVPSMGADGEAFAITRSVV
jgi:hypothetical protein